MSRSVIAVSGHGLVGRVMPHVRLERVSRVAGILTMALVLLWIAHMGTQPKAARAGQESPAGAKPGVPERAGASPAFVNESRRELNDLRGQLSDLVEHLLAAITPRGWSDRDEASQSFFVESAKTRLKAASLELDAAKMALKAYQDAIFKSQQREYEAELELARSDVKRAAPRLEQAKERDRKIPKAPEGSLMRLSQEWRFEADIFSLQHDERKAQFGLKVAQSKLTALVDYEKGQRTKQLMSEVEKARSNVLAYQANHELEQSKLESVRRLQKGRLSLSPSQARTLELLEAAIPIEEHWSAKLDQCAKTDSPGDSLRKDVRDLAQRLAAIVDLAREQEAETSLAALKRKLARSPRR